MLAPEEIAAAQSEQTRPIARQRPDRLRPRITAAERAVHAAFVAKELGDRTLWKLDA
jgi:hypothetical protein